MKIFIPIVLVIVAAVIVTGFFLIGSPNEQRMLRFDEQRLGHLQMIQSEILNYYQVTRKLPVKLSDLVDPTRNVSIPKDPETNADYGYTVKSSQDFELCADFARASQQDPNGPRAVPIDYYGNSDSWIHPAGHFCFDRPIKSEFFPPNPVPPVKY